MQGWGVGGGWGERLWEQRAAEPGAEGQEVGAGLCMGRGAFVQQEWLRETKQRGWGAAAGWGLDGGWRGVVEGWMGAGGPSDCCPLLPLLQQGMNYSG